MSTVAAMRPVIAFQITVGVLAVLAVGQATSASSAQAESSTTAAHVVSPDFAPTVVWAFGDTYSDSPAPVWVAAPECPPRVSRLPTPPAPVGAIAITVTVPRFAVVDVDGAGRLVAASTNTGCHPAIGDEVSFRHSYGSITPAPYDAIAGIRWLTNVLEPARFIPDGVPA